MSKPADSAASPEPPGMPSQTVRSIVSLLLFIHLFAVGLAIATDTDSGPSKLLRDIKERTPGLDNYLRQFALDRGYDYHLMNNEPLDFDHHLEATIYFADGKTKTMIFPPPGIWPGERRQRYAQMAWKMDMFSVLANSLDPSVAENGARGKSLLPGSIGGALLRRYASEGAQRVAVKCVCHLGVSPEQVRRGDPKEKDPNDAQYFKTVADVSVVLDEEGQPQTMDVSPALEVSPLVPARGSAAPASTSQSAEPN
jgi:hypothetical protein